MMAASSEAGEVHAALPHVVVRKGDVQSRNSIKKHEATADEITPLISSPTPPSAGTGEDKTIRTYWWRWVVLGVFSMNLGLTNVLWISFASIADVMVCYYGVDYFWVNSLSMIYMVVYIPLVFPCAWLLDRYGLRHIAILCSCCTALGAALRVIGSGPGHFWVLLLGQTIAAGCNLIWGAASLLSETWFPASERATATAISGAISAQSGVLIGFMISPFIVHRSDTVDVCGNGTVHVTPPAYLFNEWSNTISSQLFYYMLGQAALALLVLALTFVAFPNAPPSPPSISRQLETYSHRSSKEHNLRTICALAVDILKNYYFLMFVVISAIIITVAGSVISIINEDVSFYFPDKDQQIGYLGAVAQGTSLIVMLAIGVVLDYTKAYYAMNVTVCVMSTIAVALFSALVQFQTHFYFLYIAAVLIGGSMAGFQAVAYEYAVEMTYPLPEGLSAGIVNVGSQILSIVFISVISQLISAKHVAVGNWLLTGLTGFGALLAIFTRPELRRVKIDSAKKSTKDHTSIQEDE